ncbi:MAG: trigger factor [Alkalinema sp. RU_4_3]|nr:trigger factor [Alkalinema sp. RU_4_3]
MKVTQEKLPASQIGLEIEVPAEMSKQTYEKVVNNLVKTLRIPGFRPGKVPRQVVIQRFGSKAVHSEVIQELVDVALKDAIKNEKIQALGNFELQSNFEDLVAAFKPGEVLTFKAAIDVQPEVKLSTYQGFKLKAEEAKLDAARVDSTIEGYRNQLATLVPVEGRPVKKGDTATVDYHGRYSPADGGEALDVPGGQATDFTIEVEEGKFIPGFVEGIEGMNIGETKDITVTFPEEYGAEELAGRPATFSITVHDIKEKELPEVDDEFASELSDGEFETIAALREMLTERYQGEADEKTKANKEQAILDELVQHLEVDLPETLIAREVEYMVTQTAMQLQQQGLDVRRFLNEDTVKMMKERSRPDAIDRLKRTMALGEVAKREQLEVPEPELKAKMEETLAEMGEMDIDPDRLRSVLMEDLLKEKILNWIESNSTLELVAEGSLAEITASEVASEAVVEVPATEVEPKAKKTTKKAEEKPAETAVEEKTAEEEKPKAKKTTKKAEEKPAEEEKPKAKKTTKKKS